MVKALIIMADYGHDPTEVAVPYQAFKDAGFHVNFATETGKTPRCDSRMLEGLSQKLLGAAASVMKLYDAMVGSSEMQSPLSWTSSGFTLDDFDVVHIPGGHDKEVRQLLDSTAAQVLLANYFPKTKKPGRKVISAICHGPLLLCNTKGDDGNSILYHCTTTALPAFFESSAYHGTRLFLGDYYKTYGAGSESVEASMRKAVKDPSQFKSSWIPHKPFVVEDTEYNYVSARFPPDAAKMSEMTVNLVHLVQGFKGEDESVGL
ncbi:Putative class I glutamine amidotransferase, ThiJ/PfpI family [Colletotrichum destructivum]|uniref:Class I glutamine amidotransferase, ThiJ/PfpI family n=1 Tax=Colletotrichum destructivum TaxID=34406 RepID=A0AAX4I586_9PEZI|nr:Putative class I glutamine amidotransferase, ThiJ/PfpI family [Colletotrichum destructivum]